MKYCKLCKKPMYTSNYSIWLGDTNYPCHKDCVKKIKQIKCVEK